jgi:AcrR family transcriptional regulator
MSEHTKPYHHGDLRRALLDSAIDMLSEENGWQFTLRELARRASVSHTASYKHFPDKAALLAELAIIGFERLREALLAARPPARSSARSAFISMSRAYVRFGTSNANLYRLMFSADARQSANEQLAERGAAAFDILIDLIVRGQRDGWLRHREPREQAGAGWAQLHGLTLLTIDGLFGPDKVGPKTINAAIEVLLEGLEASRPD